MQKIILFILLGIAFVEFSLLPQVQETFESLSEFIQDYKTISLVLGGIIFMSSISQLFFYGVTYNEFVLKDKYKIFMHEMDYILIFVVSVSYYLLYKNSLSIFMVLPNEYLFIISGYFLIYGLPRISQLPHAILSYITLWISLCYGYLFQDVSLNDNSILALFIPIFLIYIVFPWSFINKFRIWLLGFFSLLSGWKLSANMTKLDKEYAKKLSGSAWYFTKSLLLSIISQIIQLINYPFRRYKSSTVINTNYLQNTFVNLFSHISGLTDEDKMVRGLTNLVRKIEKRPTPNLISDNTVTDLLDRKAFIETIEKNITDYLNGSKRTETITLGICGAWGDGKTYVIEQILKNLQSKNSEFICITTYPWRYSTTGDNISIIRGFFTDIEDGLSDTIRSLKLRKLFKQYTKLLTAGVSITGGIPLSLDILFSDAGYKNINGQIREELKRFNYKLIIAVEDLDRMDGNEILNILKLMRTNMDFDNTVFILPYDKSSLLSFLQEKHIPISYLDKFIQSEVFLPPIRNEQIKAFILQELQDRWVVEQILTHKELSNIIDEVFEMSSIYNVVKNLRYAKRLLNGILLPCLILNKEISHPDFIELEIIKIFFPEIYDDIINNTHFYIYDTSSHFYYMLDKKAVEDKCIEHSREIFKESEYSCEHIVAVEDILGKLFPILKNMKFTPYSTFDTSERKYRISDDRYFSRYFSGQVAQEQMANEEFKVLQEKVLNKQNLTEKTASLHTQLMKLAKVNKLEEFMELLRRREIEISPKLWEIFANVVINNEREYCIEDTTGPDNIITYLELCLTQITEIREQEKIIKRAVRKFSLYRATMIIHFLNLSIDRDKWQEFLNISKEFRIEQQNKIYKRFIKNFIKNKQRSFFTNTPEKEVSFIWYVLNLWNENDKELSDYAIDRINKNPKDLERFILIYLPTETEKDTSHYYKVAFSSLLQKGLRKTMKEKPETTEKLQKLFNRYEVIKKDR